MKANGYIEKSVTRINDLLSDYFVANDGSRLLISNVSCQFVGS